VSEIGTGLILGETEKKRRKEYFNFWELTIHIGRGEKN